MKEKLALTNTRVYQQFQKSVPLVKENLLFFSSLFLFCTVFILFALQLFLQQQIQKQALLQDPFPRFQQTAYPLLARQFIPDISAEGAFVLDTSSRVILFSKNPDIRFAPASTTKITTVLTALDYFGLEDTITVKRNYVEGSGLHLFAGEKFTFRELLYALFLPSANDAAYAIADNYKGGFQAFVEKMNEKLQFLGLTNTHFVDPAGIEDDGNYTTPRDLATIASFAITHPEIAKIVSISSKTITDLSGQNSYHLATTNKLLGLYGVNGLKTGTTEEAGQVLVTSTVRNGHTYIIVVMKSTDRFGDTEKLLRLVSDNIIYLPIHP